MKVTMLKTLAFLIALIIGAKNGFAQGARNEKSSAQKSSLPAGKYACTASKYRNGSYEFIARGSVTLSAGNKYAYAGFEKPSPGTYSVDAKGNLSFKGGYLDGGVAEKFEGQYRFYLTFPANPDNRWTCSLAD